MNDREYELMFALERDHWWFATKRAIVFDHLDRYAGQAARPRILDIGCGTGMVLAEHARRGAAFAVDLSPLALDAVRRRDIPAPVVCASAHALPFASNALDLATCLDVLYHRNVKNDAQAVREIFRVLKPGGTVVFTDSALRWLWSPHDEAMHAARRYNLPEFRDLLYGAGFRVLKLSYMNCLLFPLVFARRKWDGLRPGPAKSDVARPGPLQNAVFQPFIRFR